MYLFMQPFQPPPPGPSLAGWMANAAVSSSVQSAVVAAASNTCSTQSRYANVVLNLC
jgi:hypothetical protein